MRINFKLIRTFLCVADNASFRKAADEIHLSLPAISMQIKQLEEQLGVVLFQRTTRTVELTQEGAQLMLSGRKAMAEIDAGLAQIQQAADVQRGRLTFACVPSVASSRLPLILTTFAKRYPGIAVHVRELAHKDMVEAVRRRDVDFAIGPVTAGRGDFEFKPVFVDEYCALLPHSYEHCGRSEISLLELSRMTLLKLSSSTAFRDHIDEVLCAHGLSSEAKYEFTDVHTMLAMAEAGLGVALLPRISVPAWSTLKAVRISNPTLSRTIAIVTMRGHTLSPAAARLVELCDRLLGPDDADPVQVAISSCLAGRAAEHEIAMPA